MADLLNIGVSGLQAHQRALGATGNNIVNTNTPGYSRQRVDFASVEGGFSGAGFAGSGVSVDAIERIANDFLSGQLRLDTSAFNNLDRYLENIGQIDTLLAENSTGLAAGLESFFAAIQAGADDPTSFPARELLLAESKSLTDRFNTLYGRLSDQNEVINQQLETVAAQASTLAIGIAGFNKAIKQASGVGQGAPPNDLLDKREELLRELSELVSVSVVDQNQGDVNVFIGNGQALVIGEEANELIVVNGKADPARKDLGFVSGQVVQTVTQAIKGGTLGGLLSFRREILDPSLNSLGRIAISVADTVNSQQALGIDFEGNFGSPLFRDINDRQASLERVFSDVDNVLPDDRVLSVDIQNSSVLTDSDYTIEIPGPSNTRFVVTRTTDNTVVLNSTLSGALPETISFEGINVNFESGSFRAGDRFLIQPTRAASRDIVVEAKRAQVLAFASPIISDTSLGNRGTAVITPGEVLDVTTPAFAQSGQLSPPLLIRFTSQSKYDVLDNSDPANPVGLVPPLNQQDYSIGITNTILPSTPGQTGVFSDGAAIGALPPSALTTPGQSLPGNGYKTEQVSLTQTDALTGLVTALPTISIAANQSAEVIARNLNQVTGVKASATTEVKLGNFNNDPVGILALTVTINGFALSDGSQATTGDLDANELAARVNNDLNMQRLGISAKSDGEIVTLVSDRGLDINIEVSGDDNDFVDLIRNTDSSETLRLSGQGTGGFVQGREDVTDGINFDIGGPYVLNIAVDDGNAANIVFSGPQLTGQDVVTEIQNKINSSTIGSNKVVVAIDETGRLSLRSSSSLPDSKIILSGIGSGSPIEQSLGLSNGTFGGTPFRSAVTIGGRIDVVLEPEITLTSSVTSNVGNVFTRQPEAVSRFLGFQVSIDGVPESGDQFTVGFNTNGVSDNRNAIALASLQTQTVLGNGTVSYQESYAQLVEFVGTVTAQTRINSEASESLLNQSQANVDSVSGVNLDEEAANLIRFEVAYNASARVITVARDIFDTLLNAF